MSIPLLRQYPGLMPIEGDLFRGWVALHGQDYDWADFNVRVGPGLDPGSTWTDSQRANAIKNTQYRIDAVAWLSGRPTLIEVKDRAGTSALGALLAYAHLFRDAYPDYPAPSLLLVTNLLQPNILDPIVAHGIEIAIVNPLTAANMPSGSAIAISTP